MTTGHFVLQNYNASVIAETCIISASFPVVLGNFGCDVTCEACRENSSYLPRFQASSGNSNSANWPGYEASII